MEFCDFLKQDEFICNTGRRIRSFFGERSAGEWTAGKKTKPSMSNPADIRIGIALGSGSTRGRAHKLTMGCI